MDGENLCVAIDWKGKPAWAGCGLEQEISNTPNLLYIGAPTHSEVC